MISIIKKMIFWGCLSCIALAVEAKPIIDKNVEAIFENQSKSSNLFSLIVFFNSNRKIPLFIQKFSTYPAVFIEPLNFMPALILTGNRSLDILKKISDFPSVTYIALNKPAGEKIEINPNTKKPKVLFHYPGIDKWWARNYKGQSAIIAIIDSGLAADHPALAAKKIIINRTKDSGFDNYPYGIRSPHGTGVACIYAGFPLKGDENIRGVSYKAPIILSTLAGEGSKNKENLWLTYSSLNWLFSLSPLKPSVINYSFGNGKITCNTCPDWSGMSKIVDYIVNQYKILWVTSAGNHGYINQKTKAPYFSTMTVPADNYNAITVANMNMYIADKGELPKKYYREHHAIRYSSSRGPTKIGRKKPDITAPGNNTYTCAPQPKKYQINYTKRMNYGEGYRIMGGTSAAAPHVGGAVLLIQEAGITNPMAVKALLINSADTWTDSNKPGPEDPNFSYRGGHRPILGSEWNPTYGWGYMNMDNAFNQRNHLILSQVTIERPAIEFKMTLNPQDKITLVHERRVGFNEQNRLWPLSHLKLELLALNPTQTLALDDSPFDTVHQVSLCSSKNPDFCLQKTKIEVLVRVSLLSKSLEGDNKEPFVLAYS